MTINNPDQWNEFLTKIDSLLEQGLTEVVYKKYAELVINIEKNNAEVEQLLKAEIFASFAYFLFSIYEYETFFKMLQKAQQYGYSRDEIESVLKEAFIDPNIDEFKRIYEANKQFLMENNYISSTSFLNFEELPYWLVPTGTENQFYLYDKQHKLIKDKIILYDYEQVELSEDIDVFSDYLLIEKSSWSNILSFVNQIKNRNKKTYIIIQDVPKFMSYIQGSLLNDDIISNVFIFDSLDSMDQHFRNTSTYLPRNIINLVDQSENIQNYITTIHNERLYKNNRKGDNIFLSVCIPSYNRGKRAYENIIHLLKSKYDEEIEFIISNNGTQNATKSYYEKIRDLNDSRIKYFAFDENQGYAINLSKACELAVGNYILLLSDEDILDFQALDKILDMLIQSKNTLSILRASSNIQNKLESKIAIAGEDAVLSFMLTSNYMSGIIFNNLLLKKYRGIEYVKENIDNSVCFNYPHMFWELLLCQYGNVLGTNLVLVHEGKAEKTEVDEVELESITIPYYATLEGRLKQHKDFVTIFNSLEICKNDPKLRETMYIKLCIKTFHLLSVSIHAYYIKTNTDVLKIFDEAYNYCVRSEFTDIFCNSYKNDIQVIHDYNKYFKNQFSETKI